MRRRQEMSKGNKHRESARVTARAYRRAVARGNTADAAILGVIGCRYVTRQEA
jgi:hypothetical protein